MHEHRPLTVADLLPSGPLHRLGRSVCLHETVDSTNHSLLDHAGQLADGSVAWTEFQTGGRGRLAHRWEAPRGSSVLLSVLLHEPANSLLLRLGTLLTAVAASEAIDAATDCSPSVRWPNDLVCGDRKLGGVLSESRALPGPRGATRAIVLGVGINCLQQPGHFTGDLAGKATSLECECTHPVHRAPVAAALLARLDQWLTITANPPGVDRIRAAWRARCEDVGTRVTLEQDARRYAGTILDISSEGDLIVELDEGGRRSFVAATTTRLW